MSPPRLFRLRGLEGQALTEYAFLYLFVALAIILILGVFGSQLRNTYQNIIDAIAAVL